jgi:hypothetical protein
MYCVNAYPLAISGVNGRCMSGLGVGVTDRGMQCQATHMREHMVLKSYAGVLTDAITCYAEGYSCHNYTSLSSMVGSGLCMVGSSSH